jgi:hypothetical protein
MSRDFGRFPVPALAATAQEAGTDPLATVYVSSASRKIIICPNTTIEKGFYVEQEAPFSMSWDSSREAIGQSVWEALLLFCRTPGLNPRSRKKTDWPAYRTSGAQSVRAFEEEFVRVSVQAFPCILRVQATVPVPAADGLYVGREITNACEFGTLGDLIFIVYRCSLSIAEHGFV